MIAAHQDPAVPNPLADQVAVVTGGARGLGRSIAAALARCGASLVLAGRDPDRLEDAAGELRGVGARKVVTSAGDVADPQAVAALFEEAIGELGRVDLLVNNAGITEDGPIWETDPESWWRVIEVNLRGPFLCSRAALPGMIERGSGRIINVSSGVASGPSVDQTAYATSKAGLIRFTDSLDAQTAPHGVRVFAISPGLMKTDMGIAVMERRGQLDSAEWAPLEAVTELIERIARGDLDPLAGRFLRAADDLDELLSRQDEIASRDLYQLRLRTLADDG
ncbi:MAG TPA: SDR family oxidoreductase [Thermoleophilaceae bacterium]|nr:SDR family oxidoreductase [Thermoleophilaceae bacterium]